jgi:dUTP pyrophosphatase
MPPDFALKILDQRLLTWGLPAYQSDMAAGIDLHACLESPVALAPGSPALLVSSGFAIHIGDPHVAALIVPRSGLGHKQGLVVGNLVGVIDADYMGPVMVSLWNRSAPGSAPITIAPGDRVAQMLFVPVLRPRFSVIEEFSSVTTRGVGGFGSTG